MHTKTTERAAFEADYLAWLRKRLAKGDLPLHVAALYRATAALEGDGT